MSALRVAFIVPAPTSASFAADRTIVFADDFNAPGDLRRRYFEYDDAGGNFVPAPGEGIGGGGAMRCTFEKSQVSAGSLKILFGRNPFARGVRAQETFREIFWRVYVKHETGWEGNPAKLARATCLASADWTQGFIAHVWGGKGDVLCIDPASGIVGGQKVSRKYNDFEKLRWLGSRPATTPIFHPSESGRWVCVESQIRLDTPGRRDGIFRLWIDGKLEAERVDLDWHGAWSEYAIDAVFLENYWNSGSVKRQSRWFDRFAVATRPIGPIVAADPPTVQLAAAPSGPWQAQAAADPEGRRILWSSPTIPAAERRARIDNRLLPGATLWLRVRQQGEAEWSPWHAPFRTPS